MSAPAPVVVDLGLGNLRSVERAVEAAAKEEGLGAPTLTRDPNAITSASIVVVPGQGAFRDGAAALDANGGALRRAITTAIDRGAHYLGICLGLQLLFDASEEAPGAKGLARFAGDVVRIPDDLADDDGRRLKVPHMGWNQPIPLLTPGGERIAPLVGAAGTPGKEPWFYFVHSYHALARDPSIVAATARYGCLEVTAAIARDRVVATQFHPEKSQRAGLAFLRAFLSRARDEGAS
jgi:glutamine amidotransferase